MDMARRTIMVGVLGLLALSASVQAQEQARALPLPGDVRTLDGIIEAYYEVVSGPAGESADRARDESLHHPEALVGMTGVDPDGNPNSSTMTLGEYHDRSGGPRRQGFFEWEIHRVVERFGQVAHVWSTYAASSEPNGEVHSRGINSIQLYFDGERWWIMSWFYDSERPENPIPSEYLPGGQVVPAG